MGAFPTLIFLVSVESFTIAVKFFGIGAFRALNWYNFCKRTSSFLEDNVFYAKPLYHKGFEVLFFIQLYTTKII